MWVRITDRFVHRPTVGTSIVYRPGTYNMPTAAAQLALSQGRGVKMVKKRRADEPTPEADHGA